MYSDRFYNFGDGPVCEDCGNGEIEPMFRKEFFDGKHSAHWPIETLVRVAARKLLKASHSYNRTLGDIVDGLEGYYHRSDITLQAMLAVLRYHDADPSDCVGNLDADPDGESCTECGEYIIEPWTNSEFFDHNSKTYPTWPSLRGEMEDDYAEKVRHEGWTDARWRAARVADGALLADDGDYVLFCVDGENYQAGCFFGDFEAARDRWAVNPNNRERGELFFGAVLDDHLGKLEARTAKADAAAMLARQDLATVTAKLDDANARLEASEARLLRVLTNTL